MRFVYIIVYLLLIISPLILILLTGPYTNRQWIYELGKSFGLMGFVLIALQFIIAARQRWLSRHYGLDIFFSFHKGMAVFGGFLLLSHPILMSIGARHFDIITSTSVAWYIWLGRIALLLLFVHIVISIFRSKFRIKFERWRLLHNLLGVALLLSVFIHSLNASYGDLQLTSMRILWGSLFLLALGFYSTHKFIIPAVLKKKAYTVADVRQETHNVWTLSLKPPEDQQRYDYQPGQFHFINLHRGRSLPEEEHHFTISSSPTQNNVVSSTIKESGDFTSTIGETKVGDKASIQAPFGRFSYVFHPEDRDIVFITGGIGVTPVISMLRHMKDTEADLNVLHICVNRTEKDILFRDELTAMTQNEKPRLKVVHVLSRADENWQGEKGHLNTEILDKYVDRYDDKTFYIVCPPKMRKTVMSILKDKGIKSKQIRTEVFEL